MAKIGPQTQWFILVFSLPDSTFTSWVSVKGNILTVTHGYRRHCCFVQDHERQPKGGSFGLNRTKSFSLSVWCNVTWMEEEDCVILKRLFKHCCSLLCSFPSCGISEVAGRKHSAARQHTHLQVAHWTCSWSTLQSNVWGWGCLCRTQTCSQIKTQSYSLEMYNFLK